MKKIYLLLAALAVAATACNKAEIDTETPEASETPAVQKTNMVYIGANLPEFVDNDTKATVDADYGTFAWENGDVISVLCKRAEDNQFWYVDFTYDASEGKFARDMATACSFKSGSSGIEQVNGTFTVATATEMASQTAPFAIYPAQMVATSNVNYDRLGKLFKMEGSLETDGSINFVHKSALIKLEYTDVPSIAKKIIVTNGTEVVTALLNNATGNVKTMIPVTPTGSSATITIELCMQDGTLLLAKKKNNATLVAGHLVKTPAITINPTVYLASTMTGWDEVVADMKAPMTKSGSTYTIDLQSMGDQYAKVYVVYPSGNFVKMGPGVDGDTNLSKQYVKDDSWATKLESSGAYSFTYNNISGQMSIVRNSDLAFYFYGEKNSWNYDTAIALTNNSGMYMWEGIIGGQFKFLYNKYGNSVLGGDDSNWIGADKSNIATTAANYYLMFAKPSTWQYWLADMGDPNVEKTSGSVSLTGENFNNWSTDATDVLEFSYDATNGKVWRLTYTPTVAEYVKIVKDHAWTTSWGFANLSANPLGVAGSDNIYLEKDVEYHFVLSDKTGELAIY